MNPTAANRLAHMCAYSAQAPEWEEFVRVAMPIVALAARRVCEVWGDSSTGAVHEIAQEVFLKLCEDDRRILREFQGRGDDSLAKLLRIVAVTVGTDHFRRATAEKRGGSVYSISLDPIRMAENLRDTGAVQAVEMPSLYAQLDGLLRLYPSKVSARDRKLFWLHYRYGMTPAAISRVPMMGLSPKGVESALVRLTRLLRYAIRKEKPKSGSFQNKSLPEQKTKGFSSAITINRIERRS